MTALVLPTDAPAVPGPPQGQWTYADWEELPQDGNRYEIIATGGRIRTALNGAAWLELSDPDGARRGIIAFQLPAGTGELRFKDLRLELLK